ncbi:MAG: hypothetical protein E7425_00840 [Ruminococcaceae bacterium]|jgi:hypothetical protein|nr:hypothetical protein [Oscillospiraceae bacterium]
MPKTDKTNPQAPQAADAQVKKGKKKNVGRVPTKRTINLATVNEKKFNWVAAIPTVLIVIAAAAAFAKFGVIDQFDKVRAVRSEADAMQSNIDMLNLEMANYGKLNELYAHYTYSDMKAEEMERVDRVEAMELIRRGMMKSVEVGDWSIKGNVLTVSVKSQTLKNINEMSQKLMREEMVDFCTVSDAKMQNGIAGTEFAQEDEVVQATVIVYLNKVEEAKK